MLHVKWTKWVRLYGFSNLGNCCRVFRPANPCANDEKSTFYIMCTRCSCKTHEEKSLLVSDWKWLPKAGWHSKAGWCFLSISTMLRMRRSKYTTNYWVFYLKIACFGGLVYQCFWVVNWPFVNWTTQWRDPKISGIQMFPVFECQVFTSPLYGKYISFLLMSSGIK